MSLLLDVEGLTGSANEASKGSASSAIQQTSAFHRFTAAPPTAPQPQHAIGASSLSQSQKSALNHTNAQGMKAVSPGRAFEVANKDHSSPTSSTASDSHSPPTIRRSKKRSEDGNNDDEDEDRETSQTDDNTFAWPTHSTYDEHRQLLGTEEDSSERDSDEESGDPSVAVGDHRKNVWNITKEQLNYYTTQFFSMQTNPEGVIPGNQAKEFFEKSSLPIAELRKIWQLSDVTMDGCLSIEEFLTAMHLVVLRRNNITLPDSLPTCLKPAFLKTKLENSYKKQVKREQLQETAQSELGLIRRHNKDLYESSEEIGNQRLIDDSEGIDTAKEDAADGQVSIPPSAPIASESETGSVISSPGNQPTPVNFDFTKPDATRDPHIVQPVAVRLSPDSPAVQSSDVDDDDLDHRQKVNRRHGIRTRDVGYEQLWNAGKDDIEDEDDTEDSDLESRSYGPVSLPAHQHQLFQQHPLGLSKKEGTPPPPPPRTSRTHTRSSSLDLNRCLPLRHQQQPPPAVPPRYSGVESTLTPIKAVPALSAVSRQTIAPPSVPSIASLNRDARSLQINIHEYRERNSVVARTINELHQEVSDILEERIALEYQLEQLKSFGD